jgi:hypothetical protein
MAAPRRVAATVAARVATRSLREQKGLSPKARPEAPEAITR